jgi:hypothetical protein
MSSGDNWLRLRSGRLRCLLGPGPWRRPWLRWPQRGADVLLRGDPSARVTVRGQARSRRRWKRRRGCCCSLCRCLNLQEQFVYSMRMFFAAAEAQTSYCRIIKLYFLSSCFEYQDLFVSSRIACPSESYFSRKVMSEVSVSRRRRSPSARSALLLTCTLVVFRIPLSKLSKNAKDVLAERLFPRKILTQRGFPASSPQGRVGLRRGKADPSLTVRLYLCM